MISGRSKPFKIMSLVVIALLLGYVAFRLVLSHLIANEYALLAAEGAPLTLTELNTQYPTPKNESDNAALLYLEAFKDLETADYTGSSTNYLGKMLKDPLEGPVSKDLQTAATTHLQKNSHRLKLLKAATRKPYCRFPLDYRTGIHGESDVSHLMELTYGTHLLKAQILLDLEADNPSRGLDNLNCLIQLTKALDREPSYGAYFTRAAILNSTGALINRVVNRSKLTPATLERLAAAFAERLASSDLNHALNGERCVGTIRFLSPAGRNTALLSNSDAASPVFTLPGYGDHLDIGLLRYLRSFSELQTESKGFGSNRLRSTGLTTLNSSTLPSLPRIHQYQAEFTAAMQVAEIGLRLESARLRSGVPADKLSQHLTTSGSLIDPCANGTREYGLIIGNEDMRVYSVARDGVDDGGRETHFISGLADFRAGDIAFIKRLRPTTK